MVGRKHLTNEYDSVRFIQQYKVMSFFNKYLLSHFAFILIASFKLRATSSFFCCRILQEKMSPVNRSLSILRCWISTARNRLRELRYLPIIQIQKAIMNLVMKVLHAFMELR